MQVWQRWAAQVRAYLVDTVFPPLCVTCGRFGMLLCTRCVHAIAPSGGDVCPRCLRVVTPGDGCQCDEAAGSLAGFVSVGVHSGVLRTAIHRYKYNGLYALSVPLGDLLAETVRGAALGTDMVVAVPNHARRLGERGYDHTGLLAARVAERLGLPYGEPLLMRTRQTRHQVGLDAQERQRNVEGAFAAGDLAGAPRVLLVDDVYTTGATMTECADTLRAAGAKEVWGAVLARSDSR